MKTTVISVSAALILALTAQAQIANPGFEAGDLSGWEFFGTGWRTSMGDDAYKGSYGVVNDVLTTDGDEWRGIYQNIPVRPGAKYNAGVYIRAVNVESSESWLEIQWLDSGGNVIEQLQSAHVAADQPFTLTALSDIVAPMGAVTASVRGIVQMYEAPTENDDFHVFDDFFFTDLSRVDLRIAPAPAGGLEVSWSTNATGYTLEGTGDLRANDWAPIAEPAVVSGERYIVAQSAPPPMHCYRLQMP